MSAFRTEDDRKRSIAFSGPPRRIVSLVPSDTLSVCDLGGSELLVGRTDYCELPEEIQARVPSVGGTKNPRVDAVCDLAPDLVLANQEENSRRDIETLVQRGLRVYISFPKTVAQGIAHLAKLARILHVDRNGAVKELVSEGYRSLQAAESSRAHTIPLRTFCPIWLDPLMTIHSDTYISNMLELAGAKNIFSNRERRYPLAADLRGDFPTVDPDGRDTRYPRVTKEEVVQQNPELILLPDEPYRFGEEEVRLFQSWPIAAARDSRVLLCSGKDLCWYGSRSIQAIDRLRSTVTARRQNREEIPPPVPT